MSGKTCGPGLPSRRGAVPRSKRILGAEAYWQEFRNAVLGHPSDLWNSFMSKPGTTPVEMEL
jgi:hypothetical protein